MKNFAYARAESVAGAIALAADQPNTKFLGGGTNLVDLMRETIEQPDVLVDVTALTDGGIRELENGGLSIGAAVRNTAVANHPLVLQRYPVLSQAILFGASGQIRNMATVGGNIMQRTRCYYFYDTASRCNKRVPGSGCDALEGFNRIHAVLGTSEHCIATHPSDMCVALTALEAIVHVEGPDGQRTVPMESFHRLPGDTPHIETELQPGELITSVELPPLPLASMSRYRKVRDRASFAFALVSLAVALDLQGNSIRDVRLAMGGVAHKPWRCHAAEQALKGKTASFEVFERAAEAEMAPARAYEYNGFKIELARRTLVSVLAEMTGLETLS